MRKLFKITLVIILLGFFGCKPKEVDVSKLQFNNGPYIIDSVIPSCDNKLVTYNQKKFTGIAIEKYGNGAMASYAEFKRGLKNGKIETYYPNGQIKMTRTCKKGLSYDEIKIYFEKGNLESIIPVTKGKKTGILISYYEKGYKKSSYSYMNDSLEGPFNRFDTNGTLIVSGNNISGKLDGEVKKFSDKGKLIGLAKFKQGKPEGLAEEYYESGKIKDRYYYKNGLLDGKRESFYETGQISGIAPFTNDTINGDVIIYTQNGQIYKKTKFIKGKSIDGSPKQSSVRNKSNTTNTYQSNSSSSVVDLIGIYESYEDGPLDGQKYYLMLNGKMVYIIAVGYDYSCMSDTRSWLKTGGYTYDGRIIKFNNGKLYEYRGNGYISSVSGNLSFHWIKSLN